MHFAGYVAEDAPDPSEGRRTLVAQLGVAVAGFVDQPHLERPGELGAAISGPTGQAAESVTVSWSHLLWRNPKDHDDPANLADLDEATRAALDGPLDRPLPPWLHAARRRMRYPMLWEAVETHWWRSVRDRRSAAELLTGHAEYILTNRFGDELGLTWPEWVRSIPSAALQPSTVVVDGAGRAGLLLDTDPFVLGVATELDDGRILTAVVPRADLPFVTLEFRSDVPLE